MITLPLKLLDFDLMEHDARMVQLRDLELELEKESKDETTAVRMPIS